MGLTRLQACFVCIFASVWSTVVSNTPPLVQFGPTAGTVFFSESTSIGTKLFSITATDPDSSTMTFSTVNTATSDLVSVSSPSKAGTTWTVDVTLNAALDRDRSPNIRDLLFKVSDGPSEIQGQVKLIIRDVNDNPPLFVNLPYRISLEEGTSKINTTVHVVTATDTDDGPGGSVVYSMAAQAQGADAVYNRTFIIPNENLGNVILALELDYETRSHYQYQIFAKDQGNPACPGAQCLCSSVTEPNVNCRGEPATFTVTVLDVQDTPPYFERLPYIAEVMENDTVGTSFYQVYALDGDRGVPNSVTYSIVNQDQYPISIDGQTGILRVGPSGLDSDQNNGRSYVLTVMATEVIKPGEQAGGETSATTQVAITVHDVNDNAPEFAEVLYTASVQENTPRGVPLTFTTPIEVSDKDQNANSVFSLSVEQAGAPYEAFTTLPGPSVLIQGMSTVMISVFNSSVLDYETTTNITFQLRATETGTSERNSNTTTVVLTIEDMNDNSPVFLPDQPTTPNVTEHDSPGKVLARFTAEDADSGNFGTVSYSLEDNLGKFDINATSGDLVVTADLDREEPGGVAYSLVVVATDNMAGDEAQRRSTRLNVRVSVLDTNDNPPVFQSHSPIVTVQENASPDTVLMTLVANDADDGVNGDVIYKLVSIESPATLPNQPPQDIFGVREKTGVVFVNSSLIGYPGAHNVTIMAFDSGADPHNDSTMLVVYVQDVNINEPRFVVPDETLVDTAANSLPNITVDEEQPVGSLILQLSATDLDTGNNGLVFYGLDPDLAGQFNSFSVDAVSGNLTNKQILDRETTDMFQISVKAEDQGTPTRLSRVIPFRVFLRDVNDNDPRFPPPAALTLSVGEELQNVVVGSVAIAVDDDHDPQNKIICYYIYGGGDKVNAFSLNKITGEMTVSIQQDRDVTPTVSLVIKASADCTLPTDHYTASNDGSNSYDPSDNSLLQLTIQVQDINDSPPIFDEDALTVGLLYDKEIGFEVINLVKFTRDEDTAVNSVNYYRLLGFSVGPDMPEEPVSPFKVFTNGSVVTTRLFRADEKGYFVLNVEAYDNDSQTANDIADVTIYLVSDAQRVKLVFNQLPNQVELIKGQLVTRLSDALDLTIIADKIATHITTSGTAEPGRTDVYLHARRRPSGEIVPVNELWNAFDYNVQARSVFQDMGVVETMPVLPPEEEPDTASLEKAFIIVAVILTLVCLVLIVVLIKSIRRYRRRLRAATTSAFVSNREDAQDIVPPGTNKYYAAENPLFGKDVKPVDVDRLGNDTDSLDDNAVDNTAPGADTKGREEEQEMYLELYDDDNPGMHINHLAMVLSEYERENDDEDASQPPPPYMADNGETSDKWKSSLNGHVKSDSGFNEHGSFESGRGLDNLQYTDI